MNTLDNRTLRHATLRFCHWLLLAAALLSMRPANAIFHLWQIDEIYSNASGTVQYIVLRSEVGDQQFLSGHEMVASQAGTTHRFGFAKNLPGDTANRKFLIATQGFAALGIVAPDYVVPDGFLFLPGGSIDFAGVDRVNYSAFPSDETRALNRNNTIVIAKPANFAGASAAMPKAQSGPTIACIAGWNLVGNGVEASIAIASAFNDSGKVLTIWKWLPSGTAPGVTYPTWAFYTPLESDGGKAYAASKGYQFLTSIEAGEGFWVNAKTAFSAPLPSAAAISSSSFKPTGGAHALPRSWSLIATGDAPTPVQFDAALGGASTTPSGGNLATLWAWDAARASWYFWAPELANQGGLTNYLASRGYLDFATLPNTPTGALAPTTGVWVNMP
ncbi:MAG TPA: hypothetical protein VJ001_03640 [Rhodocyclaceae bacterium]|nr:hypothetical protein [Rhodocyclaceae bacterium]